MAYATLLRRNNLVHSVNPAKKCKDVACNVSAQSENPMFGLLQKIVFVCPKPEYQLKIKRRETMLERVIVGAGFTPAPKITFAK